MNPIPLIRAALVRHRFSALAFVFLVAAGVSLSVAVVSQERALHMARPSDVKLMEQAAESGLLSGPAAH